jgi:hypothetical protein
LVVVPRTTAAVRCLLAVLLGGVPAAGLAPAAAQAAPGFAVQYTELPGEFVAGGSPSTVTVVASTDAGGRCQKVCWSMLVRVAGVGLDEVRVDRIEESGSFPLAIRATGDTARLTDRDLDPGELCRGRTVTARYRLGFAGNATPGEVTLQAEAYDRNARLLEQSVATRAVVGEQGDAASPSPTGSADPEPSGAPGDASAAPEEPSPTASAPGGVAAVPTAGTRGSTNLLGVGLIIGAVLIFLGVGILLRMRLRNRADRRRETPFYPAM